MNKTLQIVSTYPVRERSLQLDLDRVFSGDSRRFDQTANGFKSKVLLDKAHDAWPDTPEVVRLRIDDMSIPEAVRATGGSYSPS